MKILKPLEFILIISWVEESCCEVSSLFSAILLNSMGTFMKLVYSLSKAFKNQKRVDSNRKKKKTKYFLFNRKCLISFKVKRYNILILFLKFSVFSFSLQSNLKTEDSELVYLFCPSKPVLSRLIALLSTFKFMPFSTSKVIVLSLISAIFP